MAATDEVFAIRYAHAFGSVVRSAGLDAKAAQAQLKEFADTLDSSVELREVLENPSIPAEQKLAVIDAMAGRMGMIREVRNLLAVIMDHGRLSQLGDILAAYDRVADEGRGVVEAEVTTAFPLHEADRGELEAQVARLAGSKVMVSYHQDTLLLGGAVVKIGSTVYDGSVRGQLEQLRQTLVNA